MEYRKTSKEMEEKMILHIVSSSCSFLFCLYLITFLYELWTASLQLHWIRPQIV